MDETLKAVASGVIIQIPADTTITSNIWKGDSRSRIISKSMPVGALQAGKRCYVYPNLNLPPRGSFMISRIIAPKDARDAAWIDSADCLPVGTTIGDLLVVVDE